MKSSSIGKQKLDTEENDRSLTLKDLTGDYFYDHIGKFCNSDAQGLFHQLKRQSSFYNPNDDGENVVDNSVEIPEEQNQGKTQVNEIKTNQFKIKLTSLRDQYSTGRLNANNPEETHPSHH